MKNKDIIIVGIQPWDLPIAGNSKNIALEFSKNNRVLFVNYALDRVSKLKNKASQQVQNRISVIKGDSPDLIHENENLWIYTPKIELESINWIKSKSIFRMMNKWNNVRLSREIKSAISRLNFTDYILFNDTDIFRSYHLPELLDPSLSIYYLRDNIIAVDYWKHHGKDMQGELCANSDVVMANSTYLQTYAKKFNPNSFYVGQGCEIADFDPEIKTEIPIDMKDILHPIIGYVGALKSLRLDIELLEYIAKSKPEWSLVLAGPEDDDFKNSNLHNISNVFFLGSKHPDELPAYIKRFDVCLNPQIINEVTIGNYPRKIDEYLAMGKPVVATKTDAMNVFAGYTYQPTTKEEYLGSIQKALTEDSAEKIKDRINFASQHTWENQVKEIYKYSNTKIVEKPSNLNQGKFILDRIKAVIKSNKKIKNIIHRILIPKDQAKPRLWVGYFINPFFHQRGKRSKIRRSVRKDVFPFNHFSLGKGSTIEDFATINNGLGNIKIGDRVRIGLSNTIIGPATIMNDVIIAQNVVLSGLNHGYEDIQLPPHNQKCTIDEIIIEDEVWIGANSVILPGVKIGKHSIIAAGSIVTKSIPAYSVAAGNPARIIKQYNFEKAQWEKVSKNNHTITDDSKAA